MNDAQRRDDPGEIRDILSSWMRDRSQKLTESWADAIVAERLLPDLDRELITDLACVWLWVAIEGFDAGHSGPLRAYAHRVRHGDVPPIDLYAARRCFALLEEVQLALIAADFEDLDGLRARRVAAADAREFRAQYCRLLADQRCSRWHPVAARAASTSTRTARPARVSCTLSCPLA